MNRPIDTQVLKCGVKINGTAFTVNGEAWWWLVSGAPLPSANGGNAIQNSWNPFLVRRINSRFGQLAHLWPWWLLGVPVLVVTQTTLARPSSAARHPTKKTKTCIRQSYANHYRNYLFDLVFKIFTAAYETYLDAKQVAGFLFELRQLPLVEEKQNYLDGFGHKPHYRVKRIHSKAIISCGPSS